MFDEDWDTIIERFTADPAGAFLFAQFLTQVKEIIKTDLPAALQALDTGIEKLYPHTNEYQAARKLYHLALNGTLKPCHDPMVIVKEAQTE